MSFVRTLPTLAEAQRAATEYARITQTFAVVNMPNGRHLAIDWDGETAESAGWVQRGWDAPIFTTKQVEGRMK